MRKISPLQILLFIALLSLIAGLAGASVYASFDLLRPAGEFRSVVATFLFALSFIIYAILVYRLMLCVFPLPSYEISKHSQAETIYHLHLLFFLMIFYPLIKSNLVPVPIMRAVYQGLGAKLGANTYSGGILFDPIFVTIGANTIVGQGALIIPHVIEGEKLAHFPIRIGNNVTIGANAVILAGVEIDDDAIVGVGAVVLKETKIGKGEIWQGIPAKLKRPNPT